MDRNEKNDSSLNGPWLVFPEIIGVAIVAISAPFYLFQMLLEGRTTLSLVGFVGWGVAVIYTIRFIKKRQFFFALLPMLGILGIGLFVHYALFSK